MGSYTLDLQSIDRSRFLSVGGKGANLGELRRVEGLRVPDGFCVTTEAFKRITGQAPSIQDALDRLSLLKVDARDEIRALSGALRGAIEEIAIPEDIQEEIIRLLTRFGEEGAYAVRSSAPAEDFPTASFAGQQDTYLNVIGREAILHQVRRCWASLFTERAVIYRMQNGFDHRKVHLAVVVQKMVFPQAAGIMFTADPVTSNRKVVSIDASFGLGEALVSGMVNADNYKVRDGKMVDKKVSAKKRAIDALKGGGTEEREIEPERQDRQTLTDAQILRLEQLGRRIEAHFGHPQDIEWCLADDEFYIVQSRPITTLFPIPEVNDQEYHVYVSVGHQQMMTDAMKPLGLSLFLLTTRAPMRKAGGRLFVDIAGMLASPEKREALMNTLGQSEPLIRDALTTILERGDFGKASPADTGNPSAGKNSKAMSALGVQTQFDNDPTVVAELIKNSQVSLGEAKQGIQSKSGPELFEFILEDIQRLKKLMFDPRTMGVIMAGMDASAWINEKMKEWLGETNAADTLSQSVSDNITSEMGLALLDVADAIRPHPEVVGFLQRVGDDDFLEELTKYHGGQEARRAIQAYLDRFGMRCAGEIDVTRTRWSEKPTALVPMILSHIKHFEPNAAHRRFEQGRQEALAKEQALLERLKQLPDGEQKAKETKRMIDRIRNFSGYREYPKYGIINRYFVYRQALLKEAERLVRAHVLHEKEDMYYLGFEELHEVARTHTLDQQIISRRKEEYSRYERLTPPRVLTSDGEIITGRYKREDLPAGAIAGLAVSSGVITGRARVLLNMEEADLEEGDILVTTYTDPSWTPLFVSIKGLITEVGGLMTHGAVIAREYGLPAVVGVENATKRINDGQRIRVNGTLGYVELLPDAS